MKSLYEITNNFVNILEKTENGELDEEQYNILKEEISKELVSKQTGIIAYIRDRECMIDAIKNEEKRLSDLRKNIENSTSRFKEYVKNNMERLNIESVETSLGKISLAKNPISVEIINEAEIPNEFKKIVTETKTDKAAIKKHFSDTGEIIPGVKIITDKKSIRIK